jgi:hypothetical protein
MKCVTNKREHNREERDILLASVDASIVYGLQHQKILPINVEEYPERLREKGASFVTLEIDGALRGCIGTLESYQPLILDVVKNAYAAAFCDPRFMPLQMAEYPKIKKHISILSDAELMHVTSEEDLLRKIRPNIDGLILCDKGLRCTFLPAVWESLPDPKEFLRHLKLKGGFAENYWSDTIEVYRYVSETIE